MKKTIITTVLLATLTAVSAQDATSPKMEKANDANKTELQAGEKVDQRTEVMTKELGLTADQSAKVQVANERFAKNMAELKQAIPDAEARQARANVLRTSHDRELQQILTAEQYEKMLAMRHTRTAAPAEKEMKTKMPHNE